MGQNMQFWFAAIKTNVHLLEYAPNDLKGDRDIVLEAVKKNPFMLKYASKELQEDEELLAIANDW